MIADLTRLLGVVALLLSFGVLAGRQLQLISYLGQCAVIALMALCQAVLQADWTLVAVPVVLAAQGAWLRRDRPALAKPAASLVTILCGGLILVVLAMASAPSDALAVPFAILLLGLFGAAASQGAFGVLLLLNGVVLAMIAAPGLPLRAVTTLALSLLAVVVARDGAPMGWMRR